MSGTTLTVERIAGDTAHYRITNAEGNTIKRGQQRMLTRKSGEASDVAGLLVDGGYLVGWVDERSGDIVLAGERIVRLVRQSGGTIGRANQQP